MNQGVISMTSEPDAPEMARTFRRRPTLGLASLIALLLSSAIGLRGAASEHRAHLSDDLLKHQAGRSAARVRVIVHGSRSELEALAERNHLNVAKWLKEGAVLQANNVELSRLASETAIDHLSGDPLVGTAMSVSNQSTLAAQTRAGTSGLLGIGAVPGVTGQGVVVAVVDSGIAKHNALNNKVLASVSFVTGDPSTVDVYGHGTHVAGIIAGTGTAAAGVTTQYDGGIAPGVQLVNVRVLGANGVGYTSDVINGIDWVIENRARYNIRAMNISLGHPVGESSTTDPLCEAVARAVGAGIVVVASAGNDGRTVNGVPILGGITSPGNSPFAITVGAINTWGTPSRSDDTIATYSSRGPTKYDLTIKPDLAAPGNRIISLEALNSSLSKGHPTLHRAGSGWNEYMQLSGTSMAAPIVTGAVALLLQGTPGLGTAQVKIALQSGATYMPDAGLLGAGAGSLNIWTSRKIAANGLVSLTTTLLGGLLGPSGASYWDAGSLAARLYDGVGLRLLSFLDLSKIWSNTSLLKFGDLNLVGPVNLLSLVPPNRLIWGAEVTGWTSEQHIIWGTDMYDDGGDHIIWGTSEDDDHIIWGTSGPMTDDEPQ
jgi:serine protease AprX